MCLFSGSLARWPNLLWPPDSKETTERALNYDPSSGKSGKQFFWTNIYKTRPDFTLSQMVLPFLISSSCSWLQELKQHLCDQRTPQSNKDRCLYALKTIKKRSKFHHIGSNWFSCNHSTFMCLSLLFTYR